MLIFIGLIIILVVLTIGITLGFDHFNRKKVSKDMLLSEEDNDEYVGEDQWGDSEGRS